VAERKEKKQMKKLLAIIVLGLLWSGNANSKGILLSCIFQNAYDGGKLMKPSDKMYAYISNDTEIYLDYVKKSINGLKTPVWNDNEIIGKLNRNIKGEFKINTTLRLNRNTGKLKQEIKAKYGTTIINFICSKAKKKF
jgi:hypothetical protein